MRIFLCIGCFLITFNQGISNNLWLGRCALYMATLIASLGTAYRVRKVRVSKYHISELFCVSLGREYFRWFHCVIGVPEDI